MPRIRVLHTVKKVFLMSRKYIPQFICNQKMAGRPTSKISILSRNDKGMGHIQLNQLPNSALCGVSVSQLPAGGW